MEVLYEDMKPTFESVRHNFTYDLNLSRNQILGGNYTTALLIACACETLARFRYGQAKGERFFSEGIGLYALGAFPSDQGLFAQGGNPSDTRITKGVGAGIKVAVFPHYLNNIVGIELESFGHGSEIIFSSSASAGSTASTNLWVFNSMANLILRYPGKVLVPYIGVGGVFRTECSPMLTFRVGRTRILRVPGHGHKRRSDLAATVFEGCPLVGHFLSNDPAFTAYVERRIIL